MGRHKKIKTVTPRQLKKLEKKAEKVEPEETKDKKPLTKGLMYEARGGEANAPTSGMWSSKSKSPKKGKKK